MLQTSAGHKQPDRGRNPKDITDLTIHQISQNGAIKLESMAGFWQWKIC